MIVFTEEAKPRNESYPFQKSIFHDETAKNQKLLVNLQNFETVLKIGRKGFNKMKKLLEKVI
jgi:hypothetical protein